MFSIEDGRKQFYQWDSNRRLIVADSAINEVHFSNRTDDSSLVCETFVENGITLVNVPNILLQNSWRIHVYAFDKEYTKHEDCYEVVAREKPADYAYTETEVLNWNTISEKVDKALDNTGYYVPSVDSNGNLTWKGSTEILPEVPAANIKGDKGDTGKDYVLTAADKQEIAGMVTADYATKEYVDSKVSSVYKYKGTVPSAMLLPDTNDAGDVYNTTFAGYVPVHKENNYTLTGISYQGNLTTDTEITLTFANNVATNFAGIPIDGADIAFWFDSNYFFIGKIISYSNNSYVVKIANLDTKDTMYNSNPCIETIMNYSYGFSSGSITSITLQSVHYWLNFASGVDYEYIPKGGNVAWTGRTWDSLGSTVDTSNFATKNDIASAITTTLNTEA